MGTLFDNRSRVFGLGDFASVEVASDNSGDEFSVIVTVMR
jgi:hypothetical protein